MIRVAIVADTRLYREGLAHVLGRDSRICVVATAAGCEEGLASLPAVLEGGDRGEAVCSPRVAARLLRRVAALAAGSVGPLRTHLTGRECEVVRLIDDGLSNKEIARGLGIEVATVKNHVHNILEKLQV